MSRIHLPSTSDIVVIGGGPAGASAARILDQMRSEHFADDERGYQVVRREFDHLLRDQAEAANTTVVESTVKRVEFDTDDTATVHVATDSERRTTVEVEAVSGGLP